MFPLNSMKEGVRANKGEPEELYQYEMMRGVNLSSYPIPVPINDHGYITCNCGFTNPYSELHSNYHQFDNSTYPQNVTSILLLLDAFANAAFQWLFFTNAYSKQIPSSLC